MTDLAELLGRVQSAPTGVGVVAFFDLDQVVISAYSGMDVVKELARRGSLSRSEVVDVAATLIKVGLNSVNRADVFLLFAQFLQGLDKVSVRELGHELFNRRLARRIFPETTKIIEAHRNKGHKTVLISTLCRELILPFQEELGFSALLCNELESGGTSYNGRLILPLQSQANRSERIESFLLKCQTKPTEAFDYTATRNQEFEHAVPITRCMINPDKGAQSALRDSEVPYVEWLSRGTPSWQTYARSVMATGSLVGSFVAGLPVWLLTGKKRAAQNFSFSLFADIASAMIKMKLDVSGEQHLWSDRPCVFVFNHQSKADLLILARLLRRNVVGIGKQEVKTVPLIGAALDFGGTIFIDRSNAGSAIEAMQPAVDALRRGEVSLVVSPEGTRTVTARLAPFKKGPFHIAMQARVPVVPIVIHNALDVAPKGDFAFREAVVAVDVLPPIDINCWQEKNIDTHIAEVRGAFLEQLGQA